jgi:dUTPase
MRNYPFFHFLNFLSFFSGLITMSQRKESQRERKSDEDVLDLTINPSRSGGKTFKKQHFEKASEEEKISFKASMRNQNLMVADIVWFDPTVDPKKVMLKQPERSFKGAVSFTMFAATPDNDVLELFPMKHLVVGTGFCVHTGLYENKSLIEDFPNWYASITGLSVHMSNGVFVAPSLLDPHDHSELKVSMFNLGREVMLINPKDPIGQIVFNVCHVPDVAVMTDLSDRFEGV